MNHYFVSDKDLKSDRQEIHFKISNKDFHFVTDNGVFSKSGLDFGSRLLLETVIGNKKDKVLDLGSGYGPIGIVYKKFNPESRMIMSEINERAMNLSKENAKRNSVEVEVLHNDGFADLDNDFSLIISNPPIRVGKDLLYTLLQDSWRHLKPGGEMIFVIHKNLGARSAVAFCEGFYTNVDVINKKSGYLIVRCTK